LLMTALAELHTVNPHVTTTATETLGDLLARLGGVSPDRIRLRPAPGRRRWRMWWRLRPKENRLFELLDGVLVEKCMGYPESLLAAETIDRTGHLGAAAKTGRTLRCRWHDPVIPGLVRIPDVAFASRARFPGGKPTGEPVPLMAPDLAVEVLSEGNTDAEMKRKREEYFKAGVRLVLDGGWEGAHGGGVHGGG